MSVNSIPIAISAEVLELNGDKTLGQKIKFLVTNVTVEPLLFLALLPLMIMGLTTQNMNLEKACRVNLNYNSSICDAMKHRDTKGYEPYQEQEVQKLVSKMISLKMIVIGTYPTLLMLFLGSWSDRYARRKPLILMPMLGDLVGSILLFLCSYYFFELPVEYSMMAETIPSALGGTMGCFFLGIYTYVSGLGTQEEKTLRIGAVVMCQNVSITIGIFLSGFMINYVSFQGVYIISSSLISIAFLYGVFGVKESSLIERTKVVQKNVIMDFFSIEHIRNTFKICFKEGPNNRKKKMMVILCISSMIMGPLHGELSVVYMYARIKCGWNEIDYSVYNSIVAVVQILGSLFALSVFSKYLKYEDATLGMIAITSKIISCVVFAFASSGLFFYIGCFIEVFYGTCHIALRSLMAKLVPPHELGQSNSVFALFEAVTPLVFGSTYTLLYNYTVDVFPGAFYIFTVGLDLITFYLFYWMYKVTKDENTKVIKQQTQEEKLLRSETTITDKSI